MAASTPITVQITGPDGAVQARAFGQESLLIGSGPEAAIRIADPAVSSAHCLLKVEGPDSVLVIDLGSGSGTAVEGQPVQGPVRLRAGQRVSLGASTVRVQFGEVTEPAAPPPTAGGRARLQVALRWGTSLVGVHEVEAGPVAAGEGPGCALFVPHPALGPGAVLAEAAADGAHRVFPPSGVPLRLGTLRRADLVASGRLAGDRLTLGPGEALEVELGSLTAVVRSLPPAPRVRREPLPDQEFAFYRLAAAALLVFLAGAIAAAITPAPEWNEGAAYLTPARYVRLVAPASRPQELGRLLRPQRAGERERPRERRLERPPAPRPGAPGPATPKAEADRQKVRHLLAGLLPAGGPPGGGLGAQVTDALGGLRAAGGAGDLQGLGGLGPRGAGTGGLGLGPGVGGGGLGGGGAPGALELGGGGARELARIVPGKTTVVGGLDREAVARVIERHQSEIKYCYDTGLQRDQALAGKVAVSWTIDPTGAVSEAAVSESTLGNPEVERCIVERIRRWRFPAPQGGGVVEVSFPWIFKTAGEGGAR